MIAVGHRLANDALREVHVIDIDASSTLLAAVANPHRLTIVLLLCERELCVTDIYEAIGLDQSAVSQHLRRLRDAGVVKTRKHMQLVFYRCENVAVKSLIDTLKELFPSLQPPRLRNEANIELRATVHGISAVRS